MVVYRWIVENWQMALAIGLLIFVLSVSGALTNAIRNALKGLRESLNPLGFIILMVIIYLIWLAYNSFIATLQ